MDELCHYGIKGQKWGVRRFQNADGSYTSEGKRRAQQQEKKDPLCLLHSCLLLLLLPDP